MSAPLVSSAHVRERMRSQRRRDTAPEMMYRRALFSLGLRYRVDLRIPPLRRRGDIVFTRWKVVVFVDGCFWHVCPIHGSLPKANREWWAAKLEANVDRDRETDRLLSMAGWRVVRIWEHESPQLALRRILAALNAAGADTSTNEKALVGGVGAAALVRPPGRTEVRETLRRPSGRGGPERRL